MLVNLGTPAAPTAAAVRRYLAEFLADPRVIELPRWLWWPLLHGVILRVRPRRSARAYARVWTEQGSPLLVESRRLAERVAARFGERLAVRLAMRYGEPSLARVLRGLREHGLRQLLVLPLYPQYSATTTASVVDAVAAELRGWRWLPELRVIGDYAGDAGWLAAVAQSIRAHRAEHGSAERLLFSFHGLPQRYVDAGDPYQQQCQASAAAIAAALGLEPDAWSVSYQSRVGRERWLTPYTDATLRELPRRGVRSVQVVCPGFAVDCLETLEEIALEGRAAFLGAGGERFGYIPALNDADAHVTALSALIERHAGGWLGAPREACA